MAAWAARRNATLLSSALTVSARRYNAASKAAHAASVRTCNRSNRVAVRIAPKAPAAAPNSPAVTAIQAIRIA
jgi:hypothetical protein